MALVLALFFRTRISIIVAALILDGLGIFMIQVHLGKVVYGPEVFARINSIGLWFPSYVTLGVNLSIIIMVACSL